MIKKCIIMIFIYKFKTFFTTTNQPRMNQSKQALRCLHQTAWFLMWWFLMGEKENVKWFEFIIHLLALIRCRMNHVGIICGKRTEREILPKVTRFVSDKKLVVDILCILYIKCVILVCILCNIKTWIGAKVWGLMIGVG
jgi:hypothetical protein